VLNLPYDIFVYRIFELNVRETRRGNRETSLTLGTHKTRDEEKKQNKKLQHGKLKRLATVSHQKMRNN
jgi:hypothetical protein